MASTSTTSRKKKPVAGSSSSSSSRNNYLKKPPVTIDLLLTDDEDDDFKPSKALQKQKGNGGQKTASKKNEKLSPVTDNAKSADPVVEGTASVAVKNDVIELPFTDDEDDKDEEGVNVDITEDTDDIAILFSAKSETFNEGKSAWRNLMGRMQQNQKPEPKGKAVKKNKPGPKRGLLLSPQSKASLSKIARSPAKKNPRLGSSTTLSVAPSKAKVEIAQQCESGTEELCEKVNEIVTDFTERKALADTNGASTTFSAFSSSLKKDLSSDSSKPTLKVASIFLPASERKALIASSSNAACSSSNSNSINEKYTASRTDFPENPNHFSGNTVILNTSATDTDPYNGTKTKVCPFYKKLPGTSFCVDAFNYGLIPGMEVYFLSHFHSDHYIGLSKKFCKTVICSYPTGNLVRMKLCVEEKCIRKLSLDKPYIICGAEVTLINANHCPGSVMFIFRLKNGQTIFHTGDFRYTSDMFDNPSVIGLDVDTLYLDTTYCSPEYDFPTQSESVSTVIASVKQKLSYRPKTLILCGSYLIGKERVYFSIADAIGSKVFANYDKRKILNAMEYPEFSSMLSGDEASCNIHVVPMFSITAKNLQEYLSKHPQYTNIIGIKPSGWQFSSAGTGCSIRSHYGDSVTIIGVPYSEHSSFSELKEFVTTLKPKRVQPTVNVGSTKKRGDMMLHIDDWMSTIKST